MPNVQINWLSNPAPDQINSYIVYQDGIPILQTPASSVELRGLNPGMHRFQVSAINVWGEGQRSDEAAIRLKKK